MSTEPQVNDSRFSPSGRCDVCVHGAALDAECANCSLEQLPPAERLLRILEMEAMKSETRTARCELARHVTAESLMIRDAVEVWCLRSTGALAYYETNSWGNLWFSAREKVLLRLERYVDSLAARDERNPSPDVLRRERDGA